MKKIIIIVLSLMCITLTGCGNGKDLVEIDFFQVAPECEYGTFEREYKKTGSEMLNFIKKRYKDSVLILSAIISAIPFYKKMGFESISTDKTRWLLKR